MARDTLTGSRIRERRMVAGLRQADLARQVGISPSYLNLIEHNRRRIGGKLLIAISAELKVEPSMLTEGAEAALIATLREASEDLGAGRDVETDRIDEFAGRFPGWAEVLASAQRRIATLEQTVRTLSDRLTHDPHLAASLHEVLSTAASIRSTASILAETVEIEPQWRDRFHRNLNQDSARLSESSKALVRYLDESEESDDRRTMPRDEAEAMFVANGYHFPALETGTADIQAILTQSPELSSRPARRIAARQLEIYCADCALLPMRPFIEAVEQSNFDLPAVSRQFGAPLEAVLRRVAAMPSGALSRQAGLVICDASGSLLFRRAVDTLTLPQYGTSCPLWPLFVALNRPMVPIHRRVMPLGRRRAVYDCFAIAVPATEAEFDRDPVYQSVMLILDVPGSELPEGPPEAGVLLAGTNCRVCPRDGCTVRREPSVLRDAL